MSVPSGDALELLGFVREELDRALASVVGRLATAPDPATAALLVEDLRRVVGALRMANMEGLVRYAEALEAAAALLKSDAPAGAEPGEVVAAVAAGAHALRSYMGLLAVGHPDRPLHLLQTYTMLRRALGEDKVWAGDLFWPQLSEPRPADTVPKGDPDSDHETTAQVARARYQRGLLAWLRGG